MTRLKRVGASASSFIELAGCNPKGLKLKERSSMMVSTVLRCAITSAALAGPAGGQEVTERWVFLVGLAADVEITQGSVELGLRQQRSVGLDYEARLLLGGYSPSRLFGETKARDMGYPDQAFLPFFSGYAGLRTALPGGVGRAGFYGRLAGGLSWYSGGGEGAGASQSPASSHLAPSLQAAIGFQPVGDIVGWAELRSTFEAFIDSEHYSIVVSFGFGIAVM